MVLGQALLRAGVRARARSGAGQREHRSTNPGSSYLDQGCDDAGLPAGPGGTLPRSGLGNEATDVWKKDGSRSIPVSGIGVPVRLFDPCPGARRWAPGTGRFGRVCLRSQDRSSDPGAQRWDRVRCCGTIACRSLGDTSCTRPAAWEGRVPWLHGGAGLSANGLKSAREVACSRSDLWAFLLRSGA